MKVMFEGQINFRGKIHEERFYRNRQSLTMPIYDHAPPNLKFDNRKIFRFCGVLCYFASHFLMHK